MIKKIRAFSLIEMLIVIAIIGILAVLGVVWYEDAVIRTNRSRGISLMQEEAVRRQQRFILTGNYGNDPPGNVINRGAYGELGDIFQLSININNAAPAGFTLFLTAGNNTNLSQRVRDANCFAITLDQTGLQQVMPVDVNGDRVPNDARTELTDPAAADAQLRQRRACWR